MKRLLMLISVMFFSFTLVFSASVDIDRADEKPVNGNTSLNMHYDYDPERYYHFIFSDVPESKDGTFSSLFDTTGIDFIKLDKLDNDILKSNGNVYVCWMIDNENPIEKLTLTIPGPLRLNEKDTLDFYASWEGGHQIGGAYGYGEHNAQVVYSRTPGDASNENDNSMKLNIWTGSIKGKPAGSYTGTMVLTVYADKK